MAEPATVFEPTDDDALNRAVAEARAQLAAGPTIPLADVVRWLDSWGTPDELPAPPWK
ncbi:MAG: CopG family transcriptional regulator [Azospirillaceae bacterium]|nr:CopG family transcriptional regulator [Azospirillaceae bacterium]